MRRKTLLNILIAAGMVLVVVTARVHGRNLLNESEYLWLIVRISVLFTALGWFFAKQFHDVVTAGKSGAKWILWLVLLFVVVLLSVATISYFVIALGPKQSSQQWTSLIDVFLRSVPMVLAPACTAAAIGVRIWMSKPAIGIFGRQ